MLEGLGGQVGGLEASWRHLGGILEVPKRNLKGDLRGALMLLALLGRPKEDNTQGTSWGFKGSPAGPKGT